MPIIDVTGPEPVEHRGYVPPRSVVVPGTRPKEFPAGTYNLACALIIGQRTESTDLKTSLNDALREHGIGTWLTPATSSADTSRAWHEPCPFSVAPFGARPGLARAVAVRGISRRG